MQKILTRDEQIELIKTAEDRHNALIRRVLDDALIREVVSQPAPTQVKSVYVRSETTRLARCG
jgi:hypothetical protein